MGAWEANECFVFSRGEAIRSIMQISWYRRNNAYLLQMRISDKIVSKPDTGESRKQSDTGTSGRQ